MSTVFERGSDVLGRVDSTRISVHAELAIEIT